MQCQQIVDFIMLMTISVSSAIYSGVQISRTLWFLLIYYSCNCSCSYEKIRDISTPKYVVMVENDTVTTVQSTI